MAINNIETLKNMNINDIDRNTLKPLDSIDIDTNLPISERYMNLLEQAENPYFFRCDNTIVKVEFSDNDLSLQEALSDTLIRKKSR